MSDEKSFSPEAIPKPNFSGLPLNYVDAVEIVSTTWDLRIFFSALAGSTGDGLRYEARSAVVMSMEHAKALSHGLAKRIKQFEDQNGSIPWTPKPE
ncbi:MAG: DUF3467 domain-containing protein [Acidobacteria bacterium]|nr:DUF3467 domain-containing protein [Acidobacteriota bacterium]